MPVDRDGAAAARAEVMQRCLNMSKIMERSGALGRSHWLVSLDRKKVGQCHRMSHFRRRFRPLNALALEALVSGGSITKAAKEAGATRETVSRWVHHLPVFLAAWQNIRSGWSKTNPPHRLEMNNARTVKT